MMTWRTFPLTPYATLPAVIVSVLFAALTAHAADAEEDDLEYKVKAGYLFNFAKFVEWPAGAFPTPSSPFVIGVVDRGELLKYWKPLLEGKVVNGHPVTLREIGRGEKKPRVHLLFVSKTAPVSPAEIREYLGNGHTLLVGESIQFAERFGSVGFIEERGAIRFALNLERTAQAGLKVSSKLSSVACLVKDLGNP
ncbi:MAG TPA: YfiR family protein [Opitutaceae bacterium]|nr:YfiR family protein [Opitutaceae bacterium]